MLSCYIIQSSFRDIPKVFKYIFPCNLLGSKLFNLFNIGIEITQSYFFGSCMTLSALVWSMKRFPVCCLSRAANLLSIGLGRFDAEAETSGGALIEELSVALTPQGNAPDLLPFLA